MDLSVLKSYMVSLGFDVNHQQMSQFNEAMRKVTRAVNTLTQGMAGEGASPTVSVVKAAAAVVGALTAVAAGTVAMMDKVAEADLGYQLFARRMFMSTDAAKRLKIATDALGYSLEDIVWGPPEVQERMRQLMKDQKEMQAGLGGEDFETQMRRIRDVRFEFTRLKVEVQYLGMAVVKSLSKALFGDETALLGKLQKFNQWLIDNIPRIANDISTHLAPALKDIARIWADIVDVGRMATSEVLKFLGALLDNDSLKTGEVSLKNIAIAFEEVTGKVRWLADHVHSLIAELDKLWQSPIAKVVWGAAAGARVGAALGPWGALGGAVIGGGAGYWLHEHEKTGPISSTSKEDVKKMIIAQAKSLGLPESLALSLAQSESNFDQSAVSSKGALGVMQLMPRTAAGLGVDPMNTSQNIYGGLSYLRTLHEKYGDWRKALQAYNWGEGHMDRLRGKVPAEVQGYADRILSRTEIGDIHVHVTHPNATAEEIAHAVAKEISSKTDKQIQRNMAQLKGQFA